MYKEYHRRFSTEEYAKLLANFDKVVLIDDTVTKRFKLFTERHKTIMEAAPQIDVQPSSLRQSWQSTPKSRRQTNSYRV